MMVLSRKANDQNRTILVIYSNHRPTSFGIITTISNRSDDTSTKKQAAEIRLRRHDQICVNANA